MVFNAWGKNFKGGQMIKLILLLSGEYTLKIFFGCDIALVYVFFKIKNKTTSNKHKF
jgi:uncharacterized membrane protein